MKIGYVRVSTVEQNEARQIEAMKADGVERIYMDKKSGKDFNRPEYQKMIASLHKGDILIIHSIDRLGRNYEEIIAEWRKITKEIEADIIVQDMPLLNTTQNKDLTGTLIADIVLQLFSYVAQRERENTRQRQKEGIEIAKKAYCNINSTENISTVEILDYLETNISSYSISILNGKKNKKFKQSYYKEIISEVLAKGYTNPNKFAMEFFKILKEEYL